MPGRKALLVTNMPFRPGEGGPGGVAVHSALLAEALAELGLEVEIAAPENGPGPRKGYHELPGLEDGVVPSPAWSAALNGLAGRLRREGPLAAVFSQGYSAFGLRLAGAEPLYSFAHNIHLKHYHHRLLEVTSPRSAAAYCLRSVPQLAWRMLRYEIPFYRSCRAVFSVLAGNDRLLTGIYGLDRDSVTNFPLWVDTDVFSPDPARGLKARARLGIGAGTKVFLMAGSDWRPKGLHLGIGAFAASRKELGDAALVVAGPGCGSAYAAAHAGAAGTGGIVALGEVSRAEMPDLYRAADTFLLPTMLLEPHPYTALEAAATGLPVIFSSGGGRDAVFSGCGMAFRAGSGTALADALRRAAAPGGGLESMGKAARKKAERDFGKERALERLSGLFSGGGR